MQLKALSHGFQSGKVSDRFDSEGKTSWPDPDLYLPNLLDLADHSHAQPETFDLLFNKDCRAHILNAILEWWQRERNSFKQKACYPEFFSNDIRNRINLVLKVIFTCALGKEPLAETDACELSAFLDEASNFHQHVPYCYPIYAHLNRESQQVHWKKLRVALWHSDADIANEALHACWRWQSLADRLGLAPMPHNVFESLVMTIGNLHGWLSCHACNVISRLISEDYLENEDYDLTQLMDAVHSAAVKLGYEQEARETFVRAGLDEEMHVHHRKYLASLLVRMCKKGIPIGSTAEKMATSSRRRSIF